MKWLDNTALVIVIIGAVNWLLVGIFQFDLVAFLFGNLSSHGTAVSSLYFPLIPELINLVILS